MNNVCNWRQQRGERSRGFKFGSSLFTSTEIELHSRVGENNTANSTGITAGGQNPGADFTHLKPCWSFCSQGRDTNSLLQRVVRAVETSRGALQLHDRLLKLSREGEKEGISTERGGGGGGEGTRGCVCAHSLSSARSEKWSGIIYEDAAVIQAAVHNWLYLCCISRRRLSSPLARSVFMQLVIR